MVNRIVGQEIAKNVLLTDLLTFLIVRAGTDTVMARWHLADSALDEDSSIHVGSSLFRELNFAIVS